MEDKEKRKLIRFLQAFDDAVLTRKATKFLERHNKTLTEIAELKRKVKWRRKIRRRFKPRRGHPPIPRRFPHYQERAGQQVRGGKQTRLISNIRVPIGEHLSKRSRGGAHWRWKTIYRAGAAWLLRPRQLILLLVAGFALRGDE